MSTWRPKPVIRPKVVGIAKQEDRLLVCEVLDDHGTLKGWVPLGGEIDFGETSEQALRREIREELGSEISLLGPPMVCDNIFMHHEVRGHEIVVAFEIRLADARIYQTQRFQIHEHGGSVHWVEWMEMDRFRRGEQTLFPAELALRILSRK